MNTNKTPNPKSIDSTANLNSLYDSIMCTQHKQEDHPFTVDIPLNEDAPLKYETTNLTSTCLHTITNDNTTFESFIIDTIHQDATLSLSSKLYFTRILLLNFMKLRYLSDDFYEEECHLSLLNWIWNVKHILISWDNNSKDNKPLINDKTNSDENILSIILELLNNILIILETLPIKSNDILDLKLYEKLNKIKGYVLKLPPFPLCSCVINNIHFVLEKWKKEIDGMYNRKERNQKKKGSDEDYESKCVTNMITDAELDDAETAVSSEEDSMKKNKKVSFNLLRNKEVEFGKEDEPFKVGCKKNEYDPLIFI
jgi:hypothetical protein